jgi:hypothetical protein
MIDGLVLMAESLGAARADPATSGTFMVVHTG